LEPANNQWAEEGFAGVLLKVFPSDDEKRVKVLVADTSPLAQKLIESLSTTPPGKDTALTHALMESIYQVYNGFVLRNHEPMTDEQGLLIPIEFQTLQFIHQPNDYIRNVLQHLFTANVDFDPIKAMKRRSPEGGNVRFWMRLPRRLSIPRYTQHINMIQN